MKKRYFRIVISLILAVVLAFGFTANAFAADFSKVSDEVDIKNKMTRILASIEHEKEYYGLKDVDLTNVSVGNKIPTFEVVNGKVMDSELGIYPILLNGKIVSTFVVGRDINNEWYVQLETNLVDLTNQALSSDKFAYVYDENGLSLISENIATRIIENNPDDIEALDNTVLSRTALNTVSEYEHKKIKEQPLSVAFTLDSRNAPFARNTSRNTPGYLEIDFFEQNSGEYICWCYAATAIINYVLNTSLNYNSVWYRFNGGVNTGLATTSVINNMNTHYNMNYTIQQSSTFSTSQAYQLLVNHKPLYADFVRDGGAHAVVIR